MTRASFKLTGNTVTASWDCPFSGERVTHDYWIPRSGGYVRDERGQQVCDGLGGRGNTLTAETPDGLLKLIRAEYRKFMRETA